MAILHCLPAALRDSVYGRSGVKPRYVTCFAIGKYAEWKLIIDEEEIEKSFQKFVDILGILMSLSKSSLIGESMAHIVFETSYVLSINNNCRCLKIFVFGTNKGQIRRTLKAGTQLKQK